MNWITLALVAIAALGTNGKEVPVRPAHFQPMVVSTGGGVLGSVWEGVEPTPRDVAAAQYQCALAKGQHPILPQSSCGGGFVDCGFQAHYYGCYCNGLQFALCEYTGCNPPCACKEGWAWCDTDGCADDRSCSSDIC